MTIIEFYADPVHGSDDIGDGTSGNPTKTLTAALAIAAGAAVSLAQVRVNLLADTVEQVNVPTHNWTGGNLMTRAIIDLGDHKVTMPSDAQSAIQLVGCERAWCLQNGTIDSGIWGIESDNRSHLILGSGLTINMSVDSAHPSAGGILCNADSEVVAYGTIKFTGNAFCLMQSSFDSKILYEPATVDLEGSLNLATLFNMIVNGRIETKGPLSFTGSFSLVGSPRQYQVDTCPASQFIPGGPVAWPVGTGGQSSLSDLRTLMTIDADFNVPVNAQMVGIAIGLSAPRRLILPPAAAMQPGARIDFCDGGGINGANIATVTLSNTDIFTDGTTTLPITKTGGYASVRVAGAGGAQGPSGYWYKCS